MLTLGKREGVPEYNRAERVGCGHGSITTWVVNNVTLERKEKDSRQDTDGPDNSRLLSASTTYGLTSTPSGFLHFLYHRSSLQNHPIGTLSGPV